MPYGAAALLGQCASIAGNASNASNAAIQRCTAIAALVDRARQDDRLLHIITGARSISAGRFRSSNSLNTSISGISISANCHRRAQLADHSHFARYATPSVPALPALLLPGTPPARFPTSIAPIALLPQTMKGCAVALLRVPLPLHQLDLAQQYSLPSSVPLLSELEDGIIHSRFASIPLPAILLAPSHQPRCASRGVTATIDSINATATFSIIATAVKDGEGSYSKGANTDTSGDSKDTSSSSVPTHLSWSGEIPTQKWMNFYSRVLSRLAADPGLSLTLKVEFSADGEVSEQKLQETKVALQELGLDDDVQIQ